MNRGIVHKILFGTWLIVLASIPASLNAGPEKERTLSFYHIHTKETLTITFKRDGKYIPDALKSINWFMRDWRQNSVIKIDPRTIDILWEMHTELGSKKPINIICGYRSNKTNNMLRRTRGGQASNSLHLYGKAIDAHFPDVPVRYVRYAAMIRERGGVGYYPTSALPFVHVDTGRIRHWPRMKRDEMALLFTKGSSKHVPVGGRRLSKRDVQIARAKHNNLTTQVAAYHTLRTTPKMPVLVADSGLIKPPKPERAKRPPSLVASADVTKSQPRPQNTEPDASWTVEVEPNMRVALASPTPKTPLEKNITFEPRPSEADRLRLERLIAEATFSPLVDPPQLVRASVTGPATNPSDTAAGNVVGSRTKRADSDDTQTPVLLAPPTAAQSPPDRFQWAPGMVAVLDDEVWAASPEYDDDHPDEMAYRPFPIEPLLSAEVSNPMLTRLTKPDNARTLDMLDEASGAIPPMQLRPPQQLAQLMWRQEFTGAAVNMHNDEAASASSNILSQRNVATLNE